MEKDRKAIINAVKLHTNAIRKDIPKDVKLYYSDGVLYSLAYETKYGLKSSYETLTFAKIILETFSPDISAMSTQNFEAAARSFTENPQIKPLDAGAYPIRNRSNDSTT